MRFIDILSLYMSFFQVPPFSNILSDNGKRGRKVEKVVSGNGLYIHPTYINSLTKITITGIVVGGLCFTVVYLDGVVKEVVAMSKSDSDAEREALNKAEKLAYPHGKG